MMQDTGPSNGKTLIRVLLVDDHPIVRKGLSELIQHEKDISVVAVAESAAEALERLNEVQVDVAVVDITLKDRSGVDLIQDIRAGFPSVRCLAFSMHDDLLFAQRALKAGARGYLSKAEPPENVITAIRNVLSGDLHVGEGIASQMIHQLITDKNPPSMVEEALSQREMEIFELIGDGLGTRDIAEKLYISPKTVEAHCEHIKSKMGLKTKQDLLRKAIQWIQAGRR